MYWWATRLPMLCVTMSTWASGWILLDTGDIIRQLLGRLDVRASPVVGEDEERGVLLGRVAPAGRQPGESLRGIRAQIVLAVAAPLDQGGEERTVGIQAVIRDDGTPR